MVCICTNISTQSHYHYWHNHSVSIADPWTSYIRSRNHRVCLTWINTSGCSIHIYPSYLLLPQSKYRPIWHPVPENAGNPSVASVWLFFLNFHTYDLLQVACTLSSTGLRRTWRYSRACPYLSWHRPIISSIHPTLLSTCYLSLSASPSAMHSILQQQAI